MKELSVLGFVAAVLFAIAFLIYAASTSTVTILAPTSLPLAGLACLAMHVAGIGTGWAVPRPLPVSASWDQPLPDRSQ
jgi:hypothetical protein